MSSSKARLYRWLRLHLWVKDLDDLTGSNDGEDLDDFGNHCEVCFESVVRCPDDHHTDGPSFHRLLILYSFIRGD